MWEINIPKLPKTHNHVRNVICSTEHDSRYLKNKDLKKKTYTRLQLLFLKSTLRGRLRGK